MATVISSEYLDKHNVDKYNFKILALGGSKSTESPHKFQKTVFGNVEKKEAEEEKKETKVDTSSISSNSKDSLIESLMKKTDEMSTNFIKLQMKLEAKEEEYEQKLAQAKESSFSEGFEAGKIEASKDIESSLSQRVEQLANSISKLDSSAEDFSRSLEVIKQDLVSAAINIASEVVKVEVSLNSSEIAKNLAQEIVDDLKESSSIKLKVNPVDHGALSEYFGGLKHIEVISDSAVSAGGVIVLSDVGNVDAQINKRFERVKKTALGSE